MPKIRNPPTKKRFGLEAKVKTKKKKQKNKRIFLNAISLHKTKSKYKAIIKKAAALNMETSYTDDLRTMKGIPVLKQIRYGSPHLSFCCAIRFASNCRIVRIIREAKKHVADAKKDVKKASGT
jgi:hypothetical protein